MNTVRFLLECGAKVCNVKARSHRAIQCNSTGHLSDHSAPRQMSCVELRWIELSWVESDGVITAALVHILCGGSLSACMQGRRRDSDEQDVDWHEDETWWSNEGETGARRGKRLSQGNSGKASGTTEPDSSRGEVLLVYTCRPTWVNPLKNRGANWIHLTIQV